MTTIYDPAYRKLLNRLTDQRVAKGLTQSQAARLIGRSRNWLSKVECAQLRLDIIQFIRLCRVYGMDAACQIRQVAEELADDGDSSFTCQTAMYSIHN